MSDLFPEDLLGSHFLTIKLGIDTNRHKVGKNFYYFIFLYYLAKSYLIIGNLNQIDFSYSSSNA
jgi:hypothetical protein